MEKQDIVAIFGFVGSSAIVIWGFLYESNQTITVGVVILTATISFLYQRMSHSETRKYEQNKLAVTEVLGEIYGHLLNIISSFETAEHEYWTYQHADKTGETWRTWHDIRHSYKFFLIFKDLRSELEKFFLNFEPYRNLDLQREIMEVSNKVCESRYSKKLGDYPSFLFEVREGTNHASYPGLVFWKVKATMQINGKLNIVQLPLVKDGTQDELTIRDEEAEPFEEEFLREVWVESDKNPVISKARKDHKELHSEAERLKGELEKEISEWAK